MAETAVIKVEGLAKLERALGRLQKDARKELNRKLKAVGEIVTAEAHSLIRSKGLTGGKRSTGALDRMTRTVVSTTGTVFVRSGAMRKTGKNAPFSYPTVWEFARSGQRAFLYPALERGGVAAGEALEQLFTDLDRIYVD